MEQGWFNKPIQLGEALIYFVNHTNISCHLPMLKKGYCLRGVIIKVLFCHIYNNGLNDDGFFVPDNLFVTTFAGNIKSLNERLDTFDIIKINKPDFDDKSIKFYYLQSMCSLNHNKLVISQDDNEFFEQLICEAQLIEKCYLAAKDNKDRSKMKI